MSDATPEFNEEWRYEGWTNDENDLAYRGALDSDGNVIITGVQGLEFTPLDDDASASSSSSEFAAVKLLGESGEVVWYWTDQSSGFGEQADIIFGVDTDSNNDVILAGSTTGFWTTSNPYGVRHIAVVKLDGSTGEEIWRFQDVADDSYTSLGSYIYYGSGNAIGVAVDHDDNVFLVGWTYNSLVDGEGDPGDMDYFMMKLSGATGAEIFTVQEGLSYHNDVLYGVKVDSAGDVVAAGTSGLEDETDFLVVKISGTDGDILWEYSSDSSTIDIFHAIDIDDQDDVYVAGGEDVGGIAESPVVTKLSGTDGSLIWTYSGTATSSAVFWGVAVDPTTGWVVGTGYTEGTWLTGSEQGGYDFAAVALDGDTGEELARYQDGTDGGDYLRFAEFDSAGALFFGGYTFDSFGEADVVTLKLSTSSAPTSAPASAPVSTPASNQASSSPDDWKIAVISVSAAVLVVILLALGVACLCLKREQHKPPATSVVQDSNSGERTSKTAVPLPLPAYKTPVPLSHPLPNAGTVVYNDLPPSYDESMAQGN